MAEMKVDESFVREQETQGCIRQQSDMVPAGASDGNESKSVGEFEGLIEREFSSDESNSSSNDSEPEILRKKSHATVSPYN